MEFLRGTADNRLPKNQVSQPFRLDRIVSEHADLSRSNSFQRSVSSAADPQPLPVGLRPTQAEPRAGNPKKARKEEQ